VNITSDPDVVDVFKLYPIAIAEKIYFLRNLIIETASGISEIKTMEETLKWGEPAYLVKGGSTIRIHSIKSSPNEYAMYFNCKTKLVDTFKELYNDVFKFEGNRAIVFNEKDEVPIEELKHCVEMALTYHCRKSLPMLGV